MLFKKNFKTYVNYCAQNNNVYTSVCVSSVSISFTILVSNLLILALPFLNN